MKYIVCIPDHTYYLWQTLVQIANFREMGIEKDAIYIACYFKEKSSERLQSFVDSKNIQSEFVLYKDERPSKKYSSSMRLWILNKYFKEHPEIQHETICYMDPDVVFTKPPDFSKYMNDDIWYVSDSRSYTNSKYIKSKGDDIFQLMCDIVGIDRKTVEDNEENAGGVQYIMKNVSPDFWMKCYRDSEQLYIKTKEIGNVKVAEDKVRIAQLLAEEETKLGRSLDEKEKNGFNKKHPPYHRLQEWTADMWSVLWNAWYFGKEVKIDDGMKFSWAGHDIKDWNAKIWFHDAGVVKEDGKNFCKITHQSSPFNKEIVVSPSSCSYNYLQLIRRTEQMFPELIW